MLQFNAIYKSFGSKQVVSDLNLEVKKGQVMGLLGPNGAGKSTSMKMAAGYLRPSMGHITLNGIDVWKHPKKAKSHLGYLPERTPLYEDFTPNEYLKFVARLRKLNTKEINRAIDESIDACHLEPVRHQLISTLSKGYRHRVCLAQSLIGNPEILIFDEPTDGLDPNQKQVVRDLIDRLRAERAIIVSTHILEEVEAVCTDVFIIDHGQKIFSGSPQELLEISTNHSQIELQIEGGNLEQILSLIQAIPDLDATISNHKQKLIRIHSASHLDENTRAQILNIVINQNASVLHFGHPSGRIADSFRQLTVQHQNSPSHAV